MTATDPRQVPTATVDQILDFARSLWADMTEAQRGTWRTQIAESGGRPSNPDTLPAVAEALMIFAKEIGAI